MFFQKRKSLGFRKWLDLENHKKLIAEAVEGSDFPDRVFDYLSTAFGDKKWEKKPWKTPVSSMADGFQKFNPKDLPILHPPKSEEKSDTEYDGQTWNRMSHLMANAYGWTLEYIGELDVNDALGHIQEILTSEYLEQEFYHSHSEISYIYDKNTKKSNYKALPKPYWLRPTYDKPIKNIKIKKSWLPVGYVMDASGLGEQLGGWNEIIKNNAEPAADTQTLPPTS
jgi:hypothetical protein